MDRTGIVQPESEDAFAALYARTFPRVWAALGRAGIKRDAERQEVAQEVYLVVHRKLATRKPAVPELAWVSTIALRLGLRYVALRRTQKEQPMDEADVEDQATAPTPSPEEALSRRRRYHAVMEDVDPGRRVVFEMHEIDGHSLPEIAHALGKPLATVTTRLRLAREDITASASRMQAREARAEGRVPAPLLLPFGLGGWAPVGQLFDDAPPGMEDRVWRGLSRALARATAAGAALAASGAAVTKTTAALLGVGALVGGVVTAALLYALGLVGPRPAPPPLISRAPEEVSIAAVLAEPQAHGPSAARIGGGEGQGVASVRSAAAPPATVAGATSPGNVIDPEEERIIARAQAAFVRRNFDAARAALDEHARRFPAGRAKLGAESEHLRAKLDAAVKEAPLAAPDAGHRLFGTDN